MFLNLLGITKICLPFKIALVVLLNNRRHVFFVFKRLAVFQSRPVFTIRIAIIRFSPYLWLYNRRMIVLWATPSAAGPRPLLIALRLWILGIFANRCSRVHRRCRGTLPGAVLKPTSNMLSCVHQQTCKQGRTNMIDQPQP